MRISLPSSSQPAFRHPPASSAGGSTTLDASSREWWSWLPFCVPMLFAFLGIPRGWPWSILRNPSPARVRSSRTRPSRCPGRIGAGSVLLDGLAGRPSSAARTNVSALGSCRYLFDSGLCDSSGPARGAFAGLSVVASGFPRLVGELVRSSCARTSDGCACRSSRSPLESRDLGVSGADLGVTGAGPSAGGGASGADGTHLLGGSATAGQGNDGGDTAHTNGGAHAGQYRP